MQAARNKSSYVDTFGKDAKADHESSNLNFLQLLANRYNIQSHTNVDRWLKTANDTYYKDLLIRLLKVIHAYFHSKEPAKSVQKSSFNWINQDEIQKPPRIDKLTLRKIDLPGEAERYLKFPHLRKAKLDDNLSGYKQKFDLIKQETRIMSRDIKQRTIVRNSFNRKEDVTNVDVDLNICKNRKKLFIQGAAQINAVFENNEPKETSYQGCYKGSKMKYSNPRLDKIRFGSTLLSVSPDPFTLSKTVPRS